MPGVLQVPMVVSIWDDGYGISVSNEEQTTKQNISEALKVFKGPIVKKALKYYRKWMGL